MTGTRAWEVKLGVGSFPPGSQGRRDSCASPEFPAQTFWSAATVPNSLPSGKASHRFQLHVVFRDQRDQDQGSVAAGSQPCPCCLSRVETEPLPCSGGPFLPSDASLSLPRPVPSPPTLSSFPGPRQLFSCWETKALPSPSVPCLTGKGSKLGLPPTADSPSCPYACPFEPSHSTESPDDGACFSGRFSH